MCCTVLNGTVPVDNCCVYTMYMMYKYVTEASLEYQIARDPGRKSTDLVVYSPSYS